MPKFNTPKKKKKKGEVTEIYLFLQKGDNKSQEKGGKRKEGPVNQPHDSALAVLS